MAQALQRAGDRTLLQLDAARQALATAKSLPELKDLRDKVEAISHYAKQQQYGLEIANDAVEIRLMAERRLGELLKEIDRAQPGGDRKSHSQRASVIGPPTLADLGITWSQSSRWQQEAALPEHAFQAYVTETRAKGDELTSAAVLREAKAYLPPTKPREKHWSIEEDVDAIYAVIEKLRPRWQTAAHLDRIRRILRGIIAQLSDPEEDTP